MGVEKRKTEFGNHVYEMTTLGTKIGQKVLLRLFRILGPAAAEVLSKGEEGIGSALSLASNSTTDADLDFVTETMAAQCTVRIPLTTQAGPGHTDPVDLSKVYDGHFAGRWDEWALWIGWCVRENFGSFFEGKALEMLAARVAAEKGSGFGSPKA
jgi:hypothetical protein